MFVNRYLPYCHVFLIFILFHFRESLVSLVDVRFHFDVWNYRKKNKDYKSGYFNFCFHLLSSLT